MKTRLFGLLNIAILCFISAACGLATPPLTPSPTPIPTPSSWQNTVGAFSSIVHSQGAIPEYLLQEDAIKIGEEFDVNEYFSVLQHLAMEPGYTLDYAYYYGGIGGEPIIYARPVDQSPYEHYSEYEDSLHPTPSFPWSNQYDYLEHVQVDDTPQGFFELVVLRTMGAQFYLYWHGGYNDARIVCDHAGLEALFTTLNESGDTLPGEVKQEAYAVEFEPIIEVNDDDTVSVKVVIFSKWGGFTRVSYIFSREFPHKVLEFEAETLVEYDCGWAY